MLTLGLLASGCAVSGAASSPSDLPVLDEAQDDATAIAAPTTAPTTSPDSAPDSAADTTSDSGPLAPIDGLVTSRPIGTSYVATALIDEGSVDVWAAPMLDGSAVEPTWSLAVPTEFGGPRHFAVIDQAVADDGTAWLQIQVPVRPNGSLGWIPASEVEIEPVTTRMEIDISDRSVIVWDGDEVVLDTTGAVGADRTPTPTGSFYIRDQFPWDPESVYGPWVFALSSYSEVIDQINGGDAVVAIHGTRNNSVLGDAVSLGCIRLDNDVLIELAAIVEPGTPVEVVP